MKCSNCNAELRAGAMFCGSCGTKVVQSAPESAPKKPSCPNCGFLADVGAAFCRNCGTKLGAAQPEATPIVEVESAPLEEERTVRIAEMRRMEE